MSSIREVRHLQIPLRCIISATNNFDRKNLIGWGGFGLVYKGQSEQFGTIAVKRLNNKTASGQGELEFMKEIALLSAYEHENLVSLIRFCDEEGEKILVYKHESNGSLDKVLESKDLDWIRRLRICLDAAKGLKYLHDDVGTQHRVLHCDIKSSNILLDENWKAKISDFGLSKIGPANVKHTFIICNACGTPGYIDPEYHETGILTQKSDVYSFGVVLFEVLCGRQGVRRHGDHHEFLFKLVESHYPLGTLNVIIDLDLLKQMKPTSKDTFSTIAYQCLERRREDRPTMSQVVEQLQKALDYQVTASSGLWQTAALHLGLSTSKGNMITPPRSELIKNIVNTVSERLISSSGNRDVIGMKTRMQELKSQLQVGFGGVLMVGIHGTWGSGKSTLASAIYDEVHHKFEGSCFVQNVGGQSRMCGMKTLQEKIVSNVLNLRESVVLGSIGEGKSMMESRLRETSALIVLDDVDHLSHLKLLAGSKDWFGEGSRIIITTRDKNLLEAHNMDVLYDVRPLNREEDLELFCLHAFGANRPVKDYKKLSKNMVSKFGGHPFALKRFGAILRGKDMREWMRTSARLEDATVDEILELFRTIDSWLGF
ncbi:hypothetical protein OSB04_018371 [Centaurea solstitialis]|uniref:non-specific serine/threonine protein kinase n=1 Tax=Centaurea solstitialis TaxID=347529 RepID=A0AA38THX9_9ASTR|nr:hypothetical protein OSB04_018371 [Centaurea solstitialis]